jgi:HlyD family secretion protein
VAEAEAAISEYEAMIAQRQSGLTFAEYELGRVSPLVQSGSASQTELAQKRSDRDSAAAAFHGAKARLVTASRSVTVAEATVSVIQAQLDDCVLRSPTRGRVLYRLVNPGEVLGVGGKVVTLLDLTDVYMEIFLPSLDAARLAIGSDARITFDAATTEFAVPATISFVSPEAQFTPKQVETLQEREKLMFRVRLRIPPDLVIPHIERVKTGVRGVGYVRTEDAVPWPAFLEKRYLGTSQ